MISEPAIPPVSPGRITSLWLVLQVVNRYPYISRPEVENMASTRSLRGGGLPVAEGILLAEIGGLLSWSEGLPRLSTTGVELVSSCEKEEPTPAIIRSIALLLVKKTRPSWLAFSDPSLPIIDRSVAIPEGWREVLEDAGLFESPPSDEVSEWWNSIHEVNERLLDDLRTEIGRKGEELTIFFETARLKAVGHSDLASKVRWVSKEEDRFGFDVASFAAELVPDLDLETPILIEVKSSTSTSRTRIAFELSRNEWEVAERNDRFYFFYFWHGISPGEDTRSQTHAFGPFILRMNEIRSRIPVDSTTALGRWTNCHIELDINEMRPLLVRPESISDSEDVGRRKSDDSQ